LPRQLSDDLSQSKRLLAMLIYRDEHDKAATQRTLADVVASTLSSASKPASIRDGHPPRWPSPNHLVSRHCGPPCAWTSFRMSWESKWAVRLKPQGSRDTDVSRYA